MGALADALVSKGGYNSIDAQNAENGPRAAELSREFLGSSSSSSSGNFKSIDPGETIRAAISAMQEVNKPAVDSLQASIPETQAKYAQTRTQLQASQAPMEQKYQALLDKIKGQQTQDVTAQTKATNATLAARGLSTQDPGAQQDLAGALQPINYQYTGLANETGLAQVDAVRQLQDSIANLTPQETSDTRAIQNAIGQLTSGAGQAGLSAGINLYGTNLSAQQAAQAAQQQQAQQAIANQLAQAQLANQTKQTNYETAKPYYQPEAPNNDLAVLQQILGMSSQTNTPSSFQPIYGPPNPKTGQIGGY